MLEDIAVIPPMVDRTAQQFAVEVDARSEPQLVAGRAREMPAELFFIFFAVGDAQTSLPPDELLVIDRGKGRRVQFVPIELEIEFHAKFLRHGPGIADLVLVVTEGDILPLQQGIRRGVLFFKGVDDADICDYVVEIPLHPVNRIRFLACPVDRTRQAAELVTDQSLEHVLPGPVQIDPVIRREQNILFVSVTEYLLELGVEENFAPVGQFNGTDRRVFFNKTAEMVECQKPATNPLGDDAVCRRAGLTFELAGGRGVQTYAAWVGKAVFGLHRCALFPTAIGSCPKRAGKSVVQIKRQVVGPPCAVSPSDDGTDVGEQHGFVRGSDRPVGMIHEWRVRDQEFPSGLPHPGMKGPRSEKGGWQIPEAHVPHQPDDQVEGVLVPSLAQYRLADLRPEPQRCFVGTHGEKSGAQVSQGIVALADNILSFHGSQEAILHRAEELDIHVGINKHLAEILADRPDECIALKQHPL